MRYIPIAVLTLAAVPAFAHSGHIGPVGDHSHILAAGAVVALVAGSLWVGGRPPNRARRHRA